MKRKKILITDGLFPNKYASWRNVEILSFMSEYDTSVLVKHGKSWAGIKFDVDFEHDTYKSFFHNSDYKILIFDESYNYLDKFNNGFDGTKFNGIYKNYSYCITKDFELKVEKFDLVYHIFLGCYYDFNQEFDFPQESQVIHLYPGGGFAPGKSSQIADTTNIIVTHPLVELEIQAKGNPYISCLTAPLSMFEELPKKSRIDDGSLNVCFSSLGGNKEKGANKYWLLSILYRVIFPASKVRFHSIGNCRKSIFIEHHDPMSFENLENFYAQNVDIYLNLANSLAFNGWPLGLEAVKNGAALLTTDPNQVSEFYRSEEFHIFPLNNIIGFIREIRKCERNPARLTLLKQNHKKFAEYYAGYANQQVRIFNFLDNLTGRPKDGTPD